MLAAMAAYMPMPGAAIGQALKYTVEGKAAGSVVRGTLIHNAAKTASGNGTAFNLGAVGATQKLYVTLHVLSVTGTGSLQVTVQADNASGFPSPVSAITFGAKTAIGGDFQSAAAPGSDNWFRAAYTITGFTSVTFALVVGAQ